MLKQLLSYTFTLFAVLFSTTLAAAPQKGVMAMDAQARVMPPNAKNSAAYFTLMSHAKEDLTIISAESDVAKATELHDHLMIDGAMSMRQVPNVEVPAGEKVMFQPNGQHVMLMGLKKPLKPGQTVTITLHFSNGNSLEVKANSVMPDEITVKPKKMHGTHSHH